MNTHPLLEVKGVTKNFGGLTAASDINFSVQKGEIFSIIGPNGAGKTTLFNLITGFLAPTEGEIHFKGEKISGLPPYEVARRSIARTFQLTTYFGQNTVLENLMIGQPATRQMGMWNALLGLGSRSRIEKQTLERAHELAEFVGLKKEKNIQAALLPQIAQKQLSIGLAFATNPELLLLDEPAGGVNHEEIETLTDLITRIRNLGVTICLIEHKMSVVMKMSDRILAVSFGKKMAEGTPEEVSQNEEVIAAYLGDTYVPERKAS